MFHSLQKSLIRACYKFTTKNLKSFLQYYCQLHQDIRIIKPLIIIIKNTKHSINRIVSRGNHLMVWFKTGLSHLISKLSLRSCLTLLVSKAKMLKWLKSIKQPHWKGWSKIIDSSTFLTHFSIEWEILICSAALVKKCQ